MKKNLKYCFQSTGHGMGNNRTKRPVSGLKRKPCGLVKVSENSTNLCFQQLVKGPLHFDKRSSLPHYQNRIS